MEPGSHRQHDRLLPQDILNVFLNLLSSQKTKGRIVEALPAAVKIWRHDLRRWVGIRKGSGGGMSIRTCGCESAEYDGSRAD